MHGKFTLDRTLNGQRVVLSTVLPDLERSGLAEIQEPIECTFAVASLGHRPVEAFRSVGGTTITLGLGATADRPAVRDGRVVVAPVLPLSLAFDRRVIDGAEAADVLAEIEEGLESFKGDAGETGLMGRDVPQEH
ncbi:2-oxo acid dehydrogenase subunit E2 [Streptomyces albicerus]|uniref:2-oxo acid dehydrogenase subunit E2 n=1 Tax=Streptomyces albicerus TaxID=2569859 RepID=UPI001CED096F|nr:2-oxo acid dehydrogenase subunit E2 [Streptomyces albicerus]